MDLAGCNARVGIQTARFSLISSAVMGALSALSAKEDTRHGPLDDCSRSGRIFMPAAAYVRLTRPSQGA